jgi:hypothetical protein
MYLSKAPECARSKVNSKAGYGFKGIQCVHVSISCHKCVHSGRDIVTGQAVCAYGVGLRTASLYLPFNFDVSLKLL